MLQVQILKQVRHVKRLKDAQGLLRYSEDGGFEAWLKAEFDWSQKNAYRLINVYKLSRKFVKLTNLPIAPSAVYLLAVPSTPDEVIQDVIDRAEAGEPITLTDVSLGGLI